MIDNPIMQAILISIAVTIIVLVLLRKFLRQYKKRSYDPSKFLKLLLSSPMKRGNKFELLLSLPSSIQHDTVTCQSDKKTISFNITIPKSLTNGKYLDLGGILALTDVITSYTLLIFDKSHRVGVSVSLSGQSHSSQYQNIKLYRKHLAPGKTVKIESHVSKTGNNLGFASMTIYSLSGETLATSSHLKFMPMGFLWDKFGFLIPMFFYFMLKTFPNQFQTPTDEKKIDDSLNVYSSLMLVPKESSSSDTKPRFGFTVVTYELIENIFKAFHGGAIACAFHEASEKYLSKGFDDANISDKGRRYIRYIHIEYLSSAKGKLDIEVEGHVSSQSDEAITGEANDDKHSDSHHHSLKIKLVKDGSSDHKSSKTSKSHKNHKHDKNDKNIREKVFAQGRVLTN